MMLPEWGVHLYGLEAEGGQKDGNHDSHLWHHHGNPLGSSKANLGHVGSNLGDQKDGNQDSHLLKRSWSILGAIWVI